MKTIRVAELAKRMNLEVQDLVFKLQSIGVRVSGGEDSIDMQTLQALLAGKTMANPQQVIMRDDSGTVTEETPRSKSRQRRPPSRSRRSRPRPRRLIKEVDRRIKTLATPEPESQPEEKPPSKPTLKREEPEKPEVKAKPTKSPEPVPPEKPSRAAQLAERLAAATRREEEESDEPSARAQRRAEKGRTTAVEGIQFVTAPPADPITITEAMTVRDLAEKISIKSKDLTKLLMDRGVMASINHFVEPDMAEEIAEELGIEAVVVSIEEAIQHRHEQDLETPRSEVTEPRAPVVTIMGHVDHGKTTLLDTIRESRITAGEHGGITQHMGAYEVEVGDRKIVFLDTPGHEAFTLMRARGAESTDIVVLVVAADDGVMPQTREAIDHSRAAEVPIVVALNKMDQPGANPDKVKKELADFEVLVSDWGGQVESVEISALEGTGIEDLLEVILLTAELQELRGAPQLPAHGVILEARKEHGRGTVATVLVQDGTLRHGDAFVSGATWGRVRTMMDDRGERRDEAGPATPVEVAGFDELPHAGDPFQVVEEESRARSIAEFRSAERRSQQLAPTAGKLSLDELFEQIEEGEVAELPLVLKADVQGSAEVLEDAMTRLSTDQVKIQVIHTGVGAISTNDVLLAAASNALLYGFNVRPERNAVDLASQEEVEIHLHTVIYEIADELRRAMTGLLEPTFEEVAQGRAEVRELFTIPRIGTIAGCHVVDGTIERSSEARLLRDNVVVHEGKIASLRRFKDDASEVRAGFDCGIRLERFQDFKPGDVIEAFTREEVAPTL